MQIVAGLVNKDQLRLAAACMAALLDGQQPWAAATVEAYMVSAGHVKASLSSHYHTRVSRLGQSGGQWASCTQNCSVQLDGFLAESASWVLQFMQLRALKELHADFVDICCDYCAAGNTY